jgi:hypothetical protein
MVSTKIILGLKRWEAQGGFEQRVWLLIISFAPHREIKLAGNSRPCRKITPKSEGNRIFELSITSCIVHEKSRAISGPPLLSEQVMESRILLHHPQNDLSGHLSFFDRMLILPCSLRNFHGNVTINLIDGNDSIFVRVPLAPERFQKIIGKDAML